MTQDLTTQPPVLELLSYRHVWTHRRRGDEQYEYWCDWSDGTKTREVTLPWDRLGRAVELEGTSYYDLRHRRERVPVGLDPADYGAVI